MPEVAIELYRLIKLSGPDATNFLQGQLTQDVTQLPVAGPLLAAWCNPKGRVIAVVRLLELEDALGLVVPDALAQRILERLLMYRLRAKVEISLTDDDIDARLGKDLTDPAALIRAGVPFIDAGQSEAFTPHMLNLDKLGAISFSKGCYTGQEVVARTEHLGQSRRRLMRYEASADGLRPGDKVTDGEQSVGEVVSVAGRALLAVTPIALHARPLRVGDVIVTPQGLPYAL